MPWTDWQFWIVSIFALGGLVFLLRPLFSGRKGSTACGGCPTSSDAKKNAGRGKRASLTVEGRRVD